MALEKPSICPQPAGVPVGPAPCSLSGAGGCSEPHGRAAVTPGDLLGTGVSPSVGEIPPDLGESKRGRSRHFSTSLTAEYGQAQSGHPPAPAPFPLPPSHPHCPHQHPLQCLNDPPLPCTPPPCSACTTSPGGDSGGPERPRATPVSPGHHQCLPVSCASLALPPPAFTQAGGAR